MRANNEAKARRSAELDILTKGEGKVMSYQDLEAVRVACATKVEAKAKRKGKRGRKRKSPAEEDVIRPKAKVVRLSK